MTYHVGILGAGGISETHARAASAIPGVDVVAIWGGNPQKARRLAERHGATAYVELDAFLRHRPLDLVLVGSPSGLHAEHATAAARHGLHVVVEKPLDITSARIDALIGECDHARVRLGVFFQDRAKPGIRWLHRLVARGGLGRITLASAQVKWYRPPAYYADSRWRGTWELDGGGALMNQGIHTVDLLLWLLGDPTSVSARTRTALHDIEVEDTAVACIEFGDDALATLEVTTAAYPGFPRRLELTGTGGTVVLEGDAIARWELHTPPAQGPPQLDDSAGPARRAAVSANVSDVSAHRAVIEDFLRAVESGDRPLCDGPEGRRSVALIEAVYQSSREGRPVHMTPALAGP